MQVKLLRVLQEGEIMPRRHHAPAQGRRPHHRRDQPQSASAVDAGTFRARPLLPHLGVSDRGAAAARAPRATSRCSPIASSPTRQSGIARRSPGIEPTAFALLTAYDWPGNIRQLRNEIERAVALTPQGGTIRAESFSRDLSTPERAFGSERARGSRVRPRRRLAMPGTRRSSAPRHGRKRQRSERGRLRSARTAFESRFIAEQLRTNGGNVSRTAEALGISRVMLQKKMKEYGLR